MVGYLIIYCGNGILFLDIFNLIITLMKKGGVCQMQCWQIDLYIDNPKTEHSTSIGQ